MEQNIKRNKPSGKKKHIALWIILGIVAAGLIAGGIYVWHVMKRPDVFFEEATVQQTELATPEATPLFDIEAYLPTEEPGTTPIPAPEAEPTAAPVAQTVPPSGIVNIALFGIDAFEDGSSTSGSMPHTDANLVLAVNFNTKEVSLISIARDCFTKAPGHAGFYKFNGVFNVGGGMEDPKAGFELSCRAAELWLGGVTIPYYYGVDFQALIDLVDMLGGIDFDVDVRLILLDGRRIERGHRHLDGQGVMAYMRMRKSAGGRDSDRTERQRRMLVAIFKKLKQEGKLSMVPELLKTMGGNVYTNTTLAQTAALASFAQEIDADSIHTYSIQGSIGMAYDWAFCFIDQQSRIETLKTVYGIDAAPLGFNARAYEKFMHEHGFMAMQHLGIAKKIFTTVHDAVGTGAMSEEQKTIYAQCWKDYADLRALFDLTDRWMQAHYDGKLSREETKLLNSYCDGLKKLEKKLESSGDTLNAAFGKPVRARWTRSVAFWYDQDSDINDTYVDFR